MGIFFTNVLKFTARSINTNSKLSELPQKYSQLSLGILKECYAVSYILLILVVVCDLLTCVAETANIFEWMSCFKQSSWENLMHLLFNYNFCSCDILITLG